jgi:hypothetical protein
MSAEPEPDVFMTERPSRAVDLHGFALKEFLEFVRKEDPSWL